MNAWIILLLLILLIQGLRYDVVNALLSADVWVLVALFFLAWYWMEKS